MKSKALHATLCFAALAALPVFADRVTIRLVDAERGTPLEYLVKDAPLAVDGTVLHYRIPSRAGVDGADWKFERHSGGSEADGGALAEFEEELGVREGAANVRSDRATEFAAGDVTLATIAGDAANGAHAVHPGNASFTLANGAIAETSGALSSASPHVAELRCTPVEINIVPARGMSDIETIRISQDGREIIADSFPSLPSIALRAYLPASDTPYDVEVGDAVRFSFALTGDAAKLADGATVIDSLSIDANGLVIGIGPKEARMASVASAADASDGLRVFTDRGRRVFAEGERIQLSIRANGIAADNVELRLEWGGWSRDDSRALDGPWNVALLPVAPVALSPVALRDCGDGASAAEAEIDTSLLSPGEYTLVATAGGADARIPVVIAPLVPETNLKLFGMHKWTEEKGYPLGSLEPLANHGFNMLVHVADDFSGEETASERDAAADFLLEHGVEIMPVASDLILYFNVGDRWATHAGDRYQGVQHLGQLWRRHPNFRGIFHCTGDGPTPATMGMVWASAAGSYDIIHDQRIQALREVFEATHGKLSIDDSAMKAEFDRIGGQMVGALGFGVGMDAGMKLSGDDADKLEWVQWLNQLYPENFREERKALSGMVDSPVVECCRSWAAGAGGGMWEETFWRDLDHPMVDIRGDFGVMPFSYVSGADTICAGSTNRPWIALDLIPSRVAANGLKIFLEALSRNPAGIGFYNDGGNLAGDWSATKSQSESFDTLMNIGIRFGDLFSGLERKDEIAIVSSMRQDALAGQVAAWGAHFLASKCGYQATTFTEEQIMRDPAILDRVKALLLPGFTLAPPAEFLAALKDFQGRGGVVVADDKTAIDLPGLIRVPVAEVIFHNQVDFKASYARFEPLFEPFEKAVGPKVERFFGSSLRDVHLVRSVDGDLEYWTLFNDTLPDPAERACNGDFVQFLYEGVTADLSARAPADGTLYDALRHETVETSASDGAIRWSADLRLQPGTIYLWSPRAIDSLRVAAPAKSVAGHTISLRAEALDADGKPFAGRLPVEFVLRDPSGAVRARVERTTLCDVIFKIAANDRAGTWAWTATETATGLQAKGNFEVSESDAAPAGVAALDGMVYDAAQIRAALHDRAFDIVLDPSQTGLAETAQTLADALAKAGAKASIRILWPSEMRRYPQNWLMHTVEDEEDEAEVLSGRAAGLRVPGKNQFGTKRNEIDCAFYKKYTKSAPYAFARDAILLGRGDMPSNPLFDLVATKNRMLPRNPSPDFPAPGDALVAYAWSPFSYGHDAIVLFGQDKAGLDKAVALLAKIAATADTEVRPPVASARANGEGAAPSAPRAHWRSPRENGEVFAAIGAMPATDTATIATASDKRAKLPSMLPAVYPQHVADAAFRNGKLALRTVPMIDASGPAFAEIDIAQKTARRFSADSAASARPAASLAARNANGALPHPLDIALPDGGRISASGREIVATDADGAIRWRYQPFPADTTLSEARYPRLPHCLALSKDGTRLLASFYDLNTAGSYGPSNRQYNRPAVALLDAATGRELFVTSDFLASGLAISDDGSRVFLVDMATFDGGRTHVNPVGGPAVAEFDADGKLLATLPIGGTAGVATAGDGSLAVVSYASPRRKVTMLSEGKAIDIPYRRSDIGMAVAPDCSAAAIAYADGNVIVFAPNGSIAFHASLPAPGIPAYLDDGTLVCACDDGVCRKISTAGKFETLVDFGSAEIDAAALTAAPAPAVVPSAAAPFWEGLGETIPVKRLAPPPAPDADGGVTIAVPAMGPIDAFLAVYRCAFEGARGESATLRATVSLGGEEAAYMFALAPGNNEVAIPVRSAKAANVEVKFDIPEGAKLAPVACVTLAMDDFIDAGSTAKGRAGANRNVPRLAIPNIPGFLGDPRGVEQIAYGWPAKDDGIALPPGVERPVRSDAATLFDGDVLHAAPLYPTTYPGVVPWMPADSHGVMRSAMVVCSFEKPRSIAALGVWEHPGDLPVESFTLEYTDDSGMAEAGQNVRVGVAEAPGVSLFAGDWNLALSVSGNRDAFHVHALAKPVTARYWRFTVVGTPSAIQRIAELELYESAIDSLEGDLDIDAPAGGGLDDLDDLGGFPEL